LADDIQLTFNRGVVSPKALARVDIKRVAMSAEEQCNWVARTLGPMSVRPGLGYLGATKSNAAARFLPFVFSTTDTALIELTNNVMRVWVDDALITRPSVSTAISNGSFTTDLTNWGDVDEVGGTSAWRTGGYMGLTGDGTNYAGREQTVAVALADRNVEHALKIHIINGTVLLRVGSTSGGEEYIEETELAYGWHSLTFTPTGANFYVRFMNRNNYLCDVDSCAIESAGAMEVTTTLTADLIDDVRYTQSGDVLFLACGVTHRQQRIERRSSTSWSMVDYVSETGPFRAANSGTITLAPSALNGNVNLVASKPMFKSTHVGGLFKINSQGQTVSSSISAADTFSNPIRVTGIGASRGFTITITGTWTATVTVQRSPGAPGSWTDVVNYTTNQALTHEDGYDNQIIYYRIGIKTGNYTSGTAAVSLSISTGSISGTARATSFVSSTQLTAVVLRDFGSTTASADWQEGSWSDYRGYPSAATFFGGRLWWAGKDRVQGSVVDAFNDFDEEYLGDAGPINRSIGAGPVDSINWLLPLQTLTLGAQGAEFLCRSSSLEEPLTPNNFNMRESTTYGSGNVEATKIDSGGIFVDRTGSRVMEVVTDSATLETKELTVINPEICLPEIVRMGVQRRPDTRIHLVRSDGVVVMLIFDRAEDVKCLLTIETDGLIEDVVVLPGAPEDQVYYVVNRTVNGSTVRYLERWALASEAEGGVINKMADSYVVYSGASTTTITGLGHLVGESVVCWANSKDQGTFTVSGGGTITLPEATTYAIAGLGYEARFNSAKIGVSIYGPAVLTQTKRIDRLGLILANTHYQGLEYGQDADHLDNLPLMEDGTETAADYIWDSYDQGSFPLNGTFQTTDTRLYLKGTAPRPCTVMAAVVSVDKGTR
jgi:hypothetical protein